MATPGLVLVFRPNPKDAGNIVALTLGAAEVSAAEYQKIASSWFNVDHDDLPSTFLVVVTTSDAFLETARFAVAQAFPVIGILDASGETRSLFLERVRHQAASDDGFSGVLRTLLRETREGHGSR